MIIGKAELSGHTIVLIGAFNPMIFHPAWFAAQKLLKESEALTAKIGILHQSIAVFDLDWLHVEVTPERFTALTVHEASFEWVRDLAVGTFTVLNHTPVTMLGMNYDFHFPLKSNSDWRVIERSLAAGTASSSVFHSPKIRRIAIEDIRDFNSLTGLYTVTIEPSLKVDPGVYFGTNDHYDLPSSDPAAGSKKAVEVLTQEWKHSSDQANHYWRGIFEAI